MREISSVVKSDKPTSKDFLGSKGSLHFSISKLQRGKSGHREVKVLVVQPSPNFHPFGASSRGLLSKFFLFSPCKYLFPPLSQQSSVFFLCIVPLVCKFLG